MATFKKGHAKLGGRRKGTPNRITVGARDAIVQTFDQMGGVEAMVKWARSNPSEFYGRVFVRLLPLEAKIDSIAGGSLENLVLASFSDEMREPLSNPGRPGKPIQDSSTRG